MGPRISNPASVYVYKLAYLCVCTHNSSNIVGNQQIIEICQSGAEQEECSKFMKHVLSYQLSGTMGFIKFTGKIS